MKIRKGGLGPDVMLGRQSMLNVRASADLLLALGQLQPTMPPRAVRGVPQHGSRL